MIIIINAESRCTGQKSVNLENSFFKKFLLNSTFQFYKIEFVNFQLILLVFFFVLLNEYFVLYTFIDLN